MGTSNEKPKPPSVSLASDTKPPSPVEYMQKGHSLIYIKRFPSMKAVTAVAFEKLSAWMSYFYCLDSEFTCYILIVSDPCRGVSSAKVRVNSDLWLEFVRCTHMQYVHRKLKDAASHGTGSLQYKVNKTTLICSYDLYACPIVKYTES